jgi:Fur family ferric uptake transcriptional regulator
MTRRAEHAHEADARAELARAGLRATPQRILVLAALMARRDDVTAQSLHERLRPAHPNLGLATVYRTLGALSEAGLIDAMQHGHGTCYRRCAPGHHHHLTCIRCHKVVEVRDCEIGAWADRVGAASGFRQIAHTVELTGVCDRCAA